VLLSLGQHFVFFLFYMMLYALHHGMQSLITLCLIRGVVTQLTDEPFHFVMLFNGLAH
jgi:hypothetical protein